MVVGAMTFTPPSESADLSVALARTAYCRIQPKSIGPAESMVLRLAASDLSAAIERAPDRRYKGRSKCVLYHCRGDEGRYPDKPCLLKTELHAKHEPRKSGRKNDDVPRSHRHEKQRH